MIQLTIAFSNFLEAWEQNLWQKKLADTKFGRDFFNISWTKRKMNKHKSVIAHPHFASIFGLRIKVFSFLMSSERYMWRWFT